MAIAGYINNNEYDIDVAQRSISEYVVENFHDRTSLEMYYDHGNREALRSILSDIHRTRAVVVYELTDFACARSDLTGTVEEFLEHGVSIHSVQDSVQVHPDIGENLETLLSGVGGVVMDL